MPKKTTNAARPHVERLVSNLKTIDGRPRTVDLGAKTLIIGPNGSGKSAIQQSLQLALLGSADDLVGRDGVRDNGLLMSMVSAERLSIHAKLNSGEDYVFIAKDSGRPAHDMPGEAFVPLHAVREVLEGSAATARKAFLAWAATDVRASDVEEMVPAIYQAKYKDISGSVGRGKTPVEALLATLEYAGKRQRDASKEAGGAETLLSGMTQDLDEAPTEQDLETARRVSGELAMRLSRVQSTQAQHAALLSKITGLREQLSAPRPQAPVQVDAQEREFYAGMATAGRIAVARGLSSCPLCSSSVGTPHLTACAQFYADTLSALPAPAPAPVMPDYDGIQRRINELVQEVAALDTSLVDADVHALQAEAIAAQDRYLALRSTSDKWASLKRARDTVAEMTRESETYKAMKKELENIVGGLLKRVVDAFVARVQAFMPAGWTFGLMLEDNGKEVFRLGLVTDRRLRAALSGAEWATVTCAIAMALAAGTPADRPVLVMPEDRGWDADTLSKVLNSWCSFDGQVVIGTPTKPKKVPKGWTVIELSKDADEDVVVPDVIVPPTVEVPKPAGAFSVFVPSPSMWAMLKALGYSNGQISALDKDRAGLIIAGGIPAPVEGA
jgi:energy-coupling factor transporter ATP-binding protein EcfA2